MPSSDSTTIDFTDSSSQPRTFTSDTGTNVPLIQITAHEHTQSQTIGKPKFLPQLPSHRYRYTVWHELRSTQVKGDQLKAPRVREGPESKEETFYEVTDNGGALIHHDKTGQEKEKYRHQQENWESSLRVNLSYQKLDHTYQVKNFMRILERLRCAEEVILMDNSLHDLHNITFPRCIVANLSKNHFVSLKQIPHMPAVKHLTLQFNQIKDLSGLNKFPKLESLDMTGNAVYYSKTYRRRVFQTLPNLKLLDKIIKTKADMEEISKEDRQPEASACVMM